MGRPILARDYFTSVLITAPQNRELCSKAERYLTRANEMRESATHSRSNLTETRNRFGYVLLCVYVVLMIGMVYLITTSMGAFAANVRGFLAFTFIVLPTIFLGISLVTMFISKFIDFSALRGDID